MQNQIESLIEQMKLRLQSEIHKQQEERGKTNTVVKGVVKEPREKLIFCDFPDQFQVSQINAVSYAFRIFNVQEQPIGILQ